MDVVVKVGGSLYEEPLVLKRLCIELDAVARDFQVLVVPGGGPFADAVRKLDAKYSLSPLVSHKMAILAMDQYGLLLGHLSSNAKCCESIEQVMNALAKGMLPIFLPSKFLSTKDPFEPSWDVTSDSIAAYIATCFKTKKTVFITNVDGIFTEDPKHKPNARLLTKISPTQLQTFPNRTSVDRFLPTFLQNHSLECFVINGKSPSRLRAVLAGKMTIGTKIIQQK